MAIILVMKVGVKTNQKSISKDFREKLGGPLSKFLF